MQILNLKTNLNTNLNTNLKKEQLIFSLIRTS